MTDDAVAVQPASLGDYLAFFADEIPSWKLVVAGRVVAMAGFTEAGGRLWTYLNVKDGALSARARVLALRAMATKLKTLGRDVYVTCDREGYPGSERLLRALGFQPTQEVEHNMRVWLCRA